MLIHRKIESCSLPSTKKRCQQGRKPREIRASEERQHARAGNGVQCVGTVVSATLRNSSILVDITFALRFTLLLKARERPQHAGLGHSTPSEAREQGRVSQRIVYRDGVELLSLLRPPTSAALFILLSVCVRA